MPGILKINELVEDLTAPRWEDYPEIPGFKLLLRLPDIPESARIMSRAIMAGMKAGGMPALPPEGEEDEDQTAGRIVATADWVEYQFQESLFAVAYWQGLKVEHLAQLLPRQKVRTAGAAPDAEMAFCPENLEFLVRHSPNFSNWLSKYLRKWKKVFEAQEEKDNENLSPTPSTSPIPSA